jgi:hypothetical protein
MSPAVDVLNRVQDWFSRSGGAGLILPTGWFGRPHDNPHRLTWSAARGRTVLLELDDRLLLIVIDPEIEADGADITLRFERLEFDWQEYGSRGATHLDEFATGALTLAAPPGKEVATS